MRNEVNQDELSSQLFIIMTYIEHDGILWMEKWWNNPAEWGWMLVNNEEWLT